ncbi:PAS modulated sigma54-dependent transcriptional regulator, Fis family [Desulfonema limicola]|uniref:PAS modulated sigma54-dependent transcriptional regulator, Fis family n=1 Tax=Desulfonema limicola TaxID=45656 RepID=A0A975BDS7_9BACT|nr:sigma 54-interacting transcriptional regulator [Desulfonema limicola]QTA83496.1 PAS modulated sigma54-dependent transcriptional regulator, Fis family [Desulfonema limicola]
MKHESEKKNMEYLQAIFDQSADGLMICDAKGRILKLNKAAEILNGVKASEILGKNVKTLVKQGQIDRSATQEVLETKRQVSVIQTTPRSDYTLLVTGTPVFDDKNNIVFVVVNERDISLIESMRKMLAIVRQESEKIKDELTELTLLELKENNIVAQSDSMKHTLKLALKLSAINASNILIQGESGTGKGLLAKFIHKYSNRNPFIQINCAALPENLLEAELFGYEKGAFTGASEKGKPGLFELASGGTLFLDEIGEMSLPVQAKLLKCLDDHEIMPVGGIVSKKIECSVIAATNQDLENQTLNKKFRLDLLHRLNTFTLLIPPLRNRPEDILELVRIYLKKYNKKYKRRSVIGYKAFDMLQKYEFPGNVRELINIIKQAVVMCDKRSLDDYLMNALNKTGLPADKARPLKTSTRLADQIQAVENEILNQAAIKCRTTREAAEFLGISQPSVVRKFKEHGIRIQKGKEYK